MAFMDDHFILSNATAQKLYHGTAKDQPIIDYHCHLSPKDISEDRHFEDLHAIWLAGDHYKWRAMRANGVKRIAFSSTGSVYGEAEIIPTPETAPEVLDATGTSNTVADVGSVGTSSTAAELLLEAYASDAMQQQQHDARDMAARVM